jgi:hypothetical protein
MKNVSNGRFLDKHFSAMQVWYAQVGAIVATVVVVTVFH